jgi:type IV pilus assembly protein PilV
MRLINNVQNGASLLEVLIAIVVFSLGLIGILSAAALSVRSNQDAYTMTQVTNIANFIAGAMRENRDGVIANSYNSTYAAIDIYSATPVHARACNATTACTPPEQATDDINQLRNMMGQHLPPGATTIVRCTPQAAFANIANYLNSGVRPPYTGFCNIAVNWAQDKAGTIATREWVIQP